MEKLKDKSGILMLGAVFLTVSLLLVVLRNFLATREIDFWVVFWGNCIVFAATVLAFFLFGANKPVASKGSQAVVKQVYAGFVIKFFILVTSVMVYFYFAENINVRGVFVCFGLYFIYNLLNVKATTGKTKTGSLTSVKHHHH